MDLTFLTNRISAVDELLQNLYEHVPFGTHELDARGVYRRINALELAWLGYPREEIVGQRKFTDFLSAASQETLRQKLFTSGCSNVISDFELELVRRDGTRMPVNFSSATSVDEAGQIHTYRAVIFDLRESRQNKIRQLIADKTFESLGGMCITDGNQVILQVNHAFTKITGYTAQDIVGKTPRMLNSGIHNAAFYKLLWSSVSEDGNWQGQITNRHKDGTLYSLWMSISAVAPSGSVINYVGSFFDITASKKAEADLLQLAYFDVLTNLPNRRLLLDRLTHSISVANRSGHYGALLFVDLDYFKVINDTHGHEAGDLVLVEVAQRLRNVVRAGDTVARLGGDEFVVMLEDLDVDPIESAAQAKIVAEKILDSLSRPYRFSDFEFYCTASLGIDLYVDTVPASALLQHADLAMYQSKIEGRNQLRFFSQNMQAIVTARATLEVDLRHALELCQFRLYFQPQVNQKSQIVAAEALLRWAHPERGIVAPGEFIALAEETGLIVPIGKWVLETACAQLKAWARFAWSSQLRLAINVSARQYRHDKFVAEVEKILSDSAINPALLVLEVTESMMLDVPDAIGKMNALKKLGVTFSMDDFGTGYSSLSSLTKLPLSELKIDQSFVSNLGLVASDAIIVQATIAMGQALGLEVIAEGVETQEQRIFLEQHGCQSFQGYLFSRPLPIQDFEALPSLMRLA